MRRAPKVFLTVWLLALGLATGPASAASPVTTPGTQIAPGGGIPGRTEIPCPPSCGSGSANAATGAEEGENESLATVLLVLICAAGILYGAVKLVQQRRSRGAVIFTLPGRTLRRLPTAEAWRGDDRPTPGSATPPERAPTPRAPS